LYPSFEWAYKKIERSIKQMGARGTRPAGTENQDN
jgi:NAD+ synthase (glutamine-hydrolysing)